MEKVNEFRQFLASRFGWTEQDAPHLGQWANVGNTIGAIALRLDVLSVDQIDRILEIQEYQGGLFGEIGVQLGYLDHQKLQRLLDLLELTRIFEQGAQSVLAGRIDVAGLVAHVGEFLDKARNETGGKNHDAKTTFCETTI